MTIAARPPRELIYSVVSESRNVMQSQRMLPMSVEMRMQRCPMPNLGVVVMDMKRGSEGNGMCLLV